MAKSFLDQPGLPRGLRNNSPGDIRSGDNWQGMIGVDSGGFVRFSNVAWGIRAMATDIAGDILYDGLNTITKLINEYAPTSDNPNTAIYVSYVAQRTGFAANQALPFTLDTLRKLIRAIIQFELGEQYGNMITDADISEGLGLLNPALKAAFAVSTTTGSIVLTLLILVVAGVVVKKTFF